MAVQAADIKAFLSGGASNDDPNASLGGVISATEIVAGDVNNLFAKVSEADALVGTTKYRGFFIKNTSASTWYGVYMWLNGATQLPAYSSIEILKDDGTAQVLADEDTAPTGLSAFSAPLTKATGISLGDIAANGTVLIWVKRVIAAGATIIADNIAINFEGGNAP